MGESALHLGLDDLDERLATILRARVWNLTSPRSHNPSDAEARKTFAARSRRSLKRLLYTVPIGAIIGAAIGTTAREPAAMFGLGFMGAYLTALGTVVSGVFGAARSPNKRVSAGELRALAQGLELSKPDSVYLDTVCSLLEAGENVGDQTGRDILEALKDLLHHARYLDDRLDRLRKAASAESVDELRAERERLALRLASAADSQARSDLTQSLSICDGRMKNALALAPLIERMDAQREVVYQTLLSVQSSVARLQVAPEAARGPDVDEVKSVIAQVAAQTGAVEQAVQEVVSLRSGG